MKRIQKRIVNTKRHTVGYYVGGKRMTRGQAVKLARRGKIADAVARKGPNGWHLQSKRGSKPNLYDLPVVVKSSEVSAKTVKS